jgi:7-cyano-7-deazaguanine synthase
MSCIVLFSGGLDSTVLLALALQSHSTCIALSFNYGQRHSAELKAAAAITKHYNIPHSIISIDPAAFGRSALLHSGNTHPSKGRSIDEIKSQGIPSTYVPARNTLFISYAICQAELHDAEAIYFGANASDQHCYIDCRQDYLKAMQGVMNLATKQAVSGSPPILKTPLLFWEKPRIIQEGIALHAPLHLTLSCYDPQNHTHCGKCDACSLRKQGFSQAKVNDPTSYAAP